MSLYEDLHDEIATDFLIERDVLFEYFNWFDDLDEWKDKIELLYENNELNFYEYISLKNDIEEYIDELNELRNRLDEEKDEDYDY